ncbi:transposase [Pedobacter sp. ISL-68]|uniref:transposase n=1 Tax=unclassified Pedobacter TaxID=2628915 RepID=UPI001BE6F4C8|nr:MULTISPECIES: transposase [unclassified Pedobacter]MBT2560863.1 transposase [Pedobacter sp. ISL-64]MBT2590253.1 transposase [Pedobacter sp. ISL-68]
MSKRVFDDSFKKASIDLSNSQGAIKEIADELGISQNLLSKWKRVQQNPNRSLQFFQKIRN